MPTDIAQHFTAHARTLPDTDWHVPTLYSFAAEMSATLLVASQSRYVIDLNRPVDGTRLYPGKNETTLCPMQTFDGEPIYREGFEPGPDQIAVRVRDYWQPYHRELRSRLDALKGRFGFALLWDAHSIRSAVPRLFDGELPNLSLGTADGKSCSSGLARELLACATASRFSAVLDQRFKGGYITRHYGRPEEHVHAVQLELTQSLYMPEQPPYDLSPEAAARLSRTLQELISVLLHFRSTHEGRTDCTLF